MLETTKAAGRDDDVVFVREMCGVERTDHWLSWEASPHLDSLKSHPVGSTRPLGEEGGAGDGHEGTEGEGGISRVRSWTPASRLGRDPGLS